MMTWRLWRSLRMTLLPESHKPRTLETLQEDPNYDDSLPALLRVEQYVLYRRFMTDNPEPSKIRSTLTDLLLIVLMMGVTLIALTPYFYLSVVILAAVNISYTLRLGLVLGERLAQADNSGFFDLLRLTPSGGLTAAWAFCLSSYHRTRSVFALRSLFGLNVASGLIFLVDVFIVEHRVATVTLAAIVVVDFAHTLITGTLLTLLIPHEVEHSADTSIWLIGALLLVRVTAHLIAVTVALLPDALGISGSPILWILAWIVFVVIGELSVRVLWNRLVYQLNATLAEVQEVLVA